MSAEFGALSVLPLLLAIALAIVTRKAVLSLFLGIWAGAVIFTGSLGIVQTFEWIVAAVAGDFHARILIFTLLLGSGVAMIWNLGGSYAVRDWAIAKPTPSGKPARSRGRSGSASSSTTTPTRRSSAPR